jgi:hypothetical protein
MKQLPPLLQLAEGRRVRPRKSSSVAPKEIVLHMAVADTLRRFGKADWRWSHFPAGEARDVRTAAKLKAMGTMPGWPDFLLVSPQDGRMHALELKRAGENLSGPQREFQAWAVGNGVPFEIARSVDEALAILSAWGCLRGAINPTNFRSQSA